MKELQIKKVDGEFVNNSGQKINYTKYYLCINNIDIVIRLDETGKQIVENYLKEKGETK